MYIYINMYSTHLRENPSKYKITFDRTDPTDQSLNLWAPLGVLDREAEGTIT